MSLRPMNRIKLFANFVLKVMDVCFGVLLVAFTFWICWRVIPVVLELMEALSDGKRIIISIS